MSGRVGVPRVFDVTDPARRFVLTGAPGAGKTAILDVLGNRGWAVVPEAATDVIARQQAEGVAEPWTRIGFCDDIAALQRRRQEAPVAADVQVFDRSPLCTLALARFLGHPVTSGLAAEVERVVVGQVYDRRVLLVRPLGFITATEARRISYADALTFEVVHEQVYLEHGFALVDVAAADLADRVAFVETVLKDKHIDRQDA